MLQPLYAALHSPAALLVAVAFGLAACGDDGADDGAAGSGGGGAGQAAGTSAAGTGGAGSGGASGTNAGGSGGAGAAGNAGSGQAGTGAGMSLDGLYGTFAVELKPASAETGQAAATGIIGKVYTGTYPTPASWTKQMEANGCTLSIPASVFCQPACSNAACTAENMCTPYPPAVTVGTVTLSGIGDSKIAMEPLLNSYQPPAGVTIPNPPCAPGSEVKIEAAGGSYLPFSLSTTCIEPIQAEPSVAIETGMPLMLSWNPPADATKSRIHVKLDVSHHGGSKGKIECDVEDTGSLAVPAAQVDRLVELGVSGFPTVELTRVSESAAPASGPKNVSLTVSALFSQAVKVPGLTSCASRDEDCPQGQTCQKDLKCQ